MTALDRLQELYEKTTPGPWECVIFDGGKAYEVIPSGTILPVVSWTKQEDAAFIAAAHQAIPALIELIKAQERICEIAGNLVVVTALDAKKGRPSRLFIERMEELKAASIAVEAAQEKLEKVI